MTQKISNEEKGFRDVYWCWIANEPMIIEYMSINPKGGTKPVCSNCRMMDMDATDDPPKLSSWFKKTHKFLFHINKPK